MEIRAGYLRHIDGLRGVSILLVVLYHGFPDSVPGGFVGVDVFFVISGYIITRLLMKELQNGQFSYGGFLHRRLRRLWPTFLIVVTFVFAISWIGLAPEQFVELGESLIWALGLSSNWYFFLETDYFNEALNKNALLHTWSLAVEEQFYLVFPILLMLLNKNKRLLISSIFLVAALSFAFSALSTVYGDQQGVFFSTHLRIWELAVGVGLALLGNRPLIEQVGTITKKVALTVGIAVVLGSAIVITGSGVNYPGYIAIFPVLGAALCILFGQSLTNSKNGIYGVLESRVLVSLGLVSYALYLWHWPALQTLQLLAHNPSVLQIAVVLIVSVGLSIGTYRFVEIPIRRRRLLQRDRDLVVVFIAASAALLIMALFIVSNDGVPERLPPSALVALETGPDRRDGIMNCRPARALAEEYPQLNLYRGSGDVELKLCVFGDNSRGRPDILFWGDSQMAAIARSAASRVIDSGRFGIIVNRGACPPLLGVAWSGLPPKQAGQCARWNEKVIDLIEQTNPHKVVMVGHWDVYAPKFEGGAGSLQAVSTERTKHVRFKPLELFDAAFEATVLRVNSAVALYVLLDVPTHDLFVPQATLTKTLWPWLPEPDWISRKEQLQRRTKYVPIMEAQEDAGRLIISDPLPIFCPDIRCLGQINLEPLFYDNNHLNQKGSEFLIQNIDDIFDWDAR